MLACCDREFFATVHYHHSGTLLKHQLNITVILIYAYLNSRCRCHASGKLELALQPDGWRGNVEEEITKELYASIQKTIIVHDLSLS